MLAILLREEDAEVYLAAIRETERAKIASPTFVESCMVIESLAGDAGIREVDGFFRAAEIEIVPFTEEHAYAAREAFREFGKGRHKAGLNLGDCFSYALAKIAGEPLLFKGNDFSKTDITPAL